MPNPQKFDVHTAREALWQAMVDYLLNGGHIGEVHSMAENATAEYMRVKSYRARERAKENEEDTT